MYEIELKFCVPEFTQVNLDKQVRTKTATQQRLAAYYYDTADRALAKAGMALRVRFENGNWVQTLKTAGDGVAKRGEFNQTRDLAPDADATTIRPDLTVFDDPNAKAALERVMALADLDGALKLQYLTDVTRTKRCIKKNASQIELAYDVGTVAKGIPNADDADDQRALHELEFELLSGDASDLIEVAKVWCKRHKLYLSTVTKAERGGLLLAGKRYPAATKADLSQLNFASDISQFTFLQHVVNNCLAQILPNASAIADGSPDGNHVHQLRVGIRRLRTALKTFKNFTDAIDPNWILVLKHTFSLLGEYRDREILQIKTQPMLAAQGAPHVEWTFDGIDVLPIDAVRANDFQIVLLELIKFTHLPAPADSPAALSAVRKKLKKLFKKIAIASEHYATLDTDQQHDVRKDLKTLRYVSEFAAPLFANQGKDKGKANDTAKGKKNAKLAAFLQYLEPAQDLLGEYNDNVVGQEHYAARAATDPNALFAVGWFSGRQAESAARCAVGLQDIKNAPVFW